MTDTEDKKPRILQGTVVADRMAKTVVVSVERLVKHPRYGKYVRRRRRYQVHDEFGSSQIGDKVTIVECRPRSRHKTFKIL